MLDKTPEAPKSADERATSFQAVPVGEEKMNGNTLLVEAYALIWLILMGFLVFTWLRQRAIDARLEGLERAIDRAAAKLQAKGE
jgi:hypothetical protein